MRSIFTLSLLFISTLLLSQAPQVSQVFPTNQEVSAQPNGVISVTFDQPLDLSTVNYSNFKVFGRWSGPAELVFSMSNNDQTVEMTPFESLMHGEWVTVTLTKNIKSASGENMERSYVWNFWIHVVAAPQGVEFNLFKTIELRNPGEGLLQAYGAYAGDLNNDGFSDLTVVNETSDDLRILLNDGTGDFNDFEIIPMGNLSPSPNEGADFNNDGEIDFAVCTAHDSEMRILFGEGSGTLTGMENYATGQHARGLGVIELDGDGNDDIVIANRMSSDLTFFQNDGTGGFTSSTYNTPGTGESGLVVTDFNNDGIQDIIIGMYSSNEIIVMLGDGAIDYVLSDQVDIDGQPWMLGTGDLNGDGFADIVSANSSGDNVAVLLNDGNGGLMDPEYLMVPGSTFPLAIDLGDLNGDGHLDLVTSYYASSNYLVFYNDGSGGFFVQQNLSAGAHASCAILHDRDNDGDLDITGTDEGDDLVLLFETYGVLNVNDLNPQIIVAANPNPFKDQIQFEISEICDECVVSVFNNLGELIKTMPLNHQSAFSWNGTNSQGDEVAPGVYILQIGNNDYFESINVVKGF